MLSSKLGSASTGTNPSAFARRFCDAQRSEGDDRFGGQEARGEAFLEVQLHLDRGSRRPRPAAFHAYRPHVADAMPLGASPYPTK
jgi:hypothetical protein